MTTKISARQIQAGNILFIEDRTLTVIEVGQSKTALIRGRKTAFAMVIELSNGEKLIVHPEQVLAKDG